MLKCNYLKKGMVRYAVAHRTILSIFIVKNPFHLKLTQYQNYLLSNEGQHLSLVLSIS